MKCIIVEDQLPAQRVLKRFIADAGNLSLEGAFSTAMESLHYLQTHEVDLILLDIHLPKITGLEFLRTLKNPPHVILTTAYSEYALESYELNVVDYLLKPFTFQRFLQAVAKIPEKTRQTTSESISPVSEMFVKSGYELIKIQAAQIQYIKADGDYTDVYLSDKRHLIAEPLGYWLELLDSDRFVQVHKSYIVNISKIEKVSGNQIILLSELKVPIGRTFKEDFYKKIGEVIECPLQMLSSGGLFL